MNIITPKKIKTYNKLNDENLKEKASKYTDYMLSRNFWIYKPKCLKRSLALFYIFKEAGFDVNICFGFRYSVETPYKALEGHAWLVYENKVFLENNEDNIKTYKLTYTFPETASV